LTRDTGKILRKRNNQQHQQRSTTMKEKRTLFVVYLCDKHWQILSFFFHCFLFSNIYTKEEEEDKRRRKSVKRNRISFVVKSYHR